MAIASSQLSFLLLTSKKPGHTHNYLLTVSWQDGDNVVGWFYIKHHFIP